MINIRILEFFNVGRVFFRRYMDIIYMNRNKFIYVFCVDKY